MVIGGQTVSVDLWKNSARAESASTTTSSPALSIEADEDELPF
jgi:hypothetical protein